MASACDRPDTDFAWAAFDRRDRHFDGKFVGAVKTTGIYCRPSCPARHPKRENVEFFYTPAEASAAGYRACKRCRPDDVARDEKAIREALKLLASDNPPRLQGLADIVGYTPHHFSRIFKRDVGMSPAAWVRFNRLHEAEKKIAKGASITEAIYAAGYSAPSRYYADKQQFGKSGR